MNALDRLRQALARIVEIAKHKRTLIVQFLLSVGATAAANTPNSIQTDPLFLATTIEPNNHGGMARKPEDGGYVHNIGLQRHSTSTVFSLIGGRLRAARQSLSRMTSATMRYIGQLGRANNLAFGASA